MRKFKSVYPPPVFVAFFQGGEHYRMSFSQPADKRGNPVLPWRFPAQVAMAAQIIGDERARVGWSPSLANPLAPFLTAPATDMACCFVEWHGEVFRDEPLSLIQVARAKRAQAKREREPARKRVVVFKAKPKPKAKPRKTAKRHTRRAA